VSLNRHFQAFKKCFRGTSSLHEAVALQIHSLRWKWMMNWHVVIIHNAVPFKIIIFYWQQKETWWQLVLVLWLWDQSPLRPESCVCVCACARARATSFRPLLGVVFITRSTRAAPCDVAGDSQCLKILCGASVQRNPLKAAHFSPAIRDPQAVKHCSLSWA
jgi:hypothetical protein